MVAQVHGFGTDYQRDTFRIAGIFEQSQRVRSSRNAIETRSIQPYRCRTPEPDLHAVI
jgi:hypothetical protein